MAVAGEEDGGGGHNHPLLDPPGVSHPAPKRTQILQVMASRREGRVRAQAEAAEVLRKEREARRAAEAEAMRRARAAADRNRLRRDVRNVVEGRGAMDEIGAFETALLHHNASNTTTILPKIAGAAMDNGNNGNVTQGFKDVTPMEHLMRIKELVLPELEAAAQEGRAYAARVKQRKAEEAGERTEREIRRRKAVEDEGLSAAALSDATSSSDTSSALDAAVTAEESAEAAELSALESEREAAAAARLVREEEARAARDAAWEEALRRNRETWRMDREEHARETALARKLWVDEVDARRRAKEAARTELCRHLVMQLVGLAERVSDWRDRAGTATTTNDNNNNNSDRATEEEEGENNKSKELVPALEWRSWKGAFVAGLELLEPLRAESAMKGDAEEQAEDPVKMAMDQALVRAYLRLKGEWKDPTTEDNNTDTATNNANDKQHAVLGAVLAELAVAADPKAIPVALAELRLHDAKVAILGPPCAGKSALARRLADKCGLTIIDAKALVANAMDNEASELGRLAREATQAGGRVPDNVLAGLVAEALRVLPAPSNGVVMDDFPHTAQQAEMLEREVTGLDLEWDARRRARASLVAPPPHEEAVDKDLRSGLDAVFVLSSADESALARRTLGVRKDPVTNKVYHLDTNPPPTNDAKLLDRLEGPASAAVALMTSRLGEYVERAPELGAWFAKFQELPTSVPCDGTEDAVYTDIEKRVKEITDAKTRAKAAAAAAEAADKALMDAEASSAAAATALAATNVAALRLLAAVAVEMRALELLEDPAAVEVVQAKSAETLAAHLASAKAAHTEAAAAATEAHSASARASDARALAQTNVEAASTSLQAQETALAAAKEAEDSCERAKAAAARAEAYAGDSAEAIARAEAEKDKPRVPADGKNKGKDAAAAKAKEKEKEKETKESKDGGGKEVKDGKKGKGGDDKKDKEKKDEKKDEVAMQAHACEVLDKEFAGAIVGRWRAAESAYLSGLASSFRGVRADRASTTAHYAATRDAYLTLVNAPDEKQDVLASFQDEFNKVEDREEPEDRQDLETKAKEVRDALWDVCDRRLREANAAREASEADGFVDERIESTNNHLMNLVQHEVDLHAASCAALRGHACAKWGLYAGAADDDTVNESVTCVDVRAAVDPAEFNKPGVVLPQWLQDVRATAPSFAQALYLALSVLNKPPPMPAPASSSGPEDPNPSEQQQTALNSAAAEGELRDACVREDSALAAALERIARRGASYIGDLISVPHRAHACMRRWGDARYAAECDAVTAAMGVVMESIQAARPLPYRLTLIGVAFAVDTNDYLLPPEPVKEGPAPVRGAFTCAGLRALVKAFKASAPTGVIPVTEAAELMRQLASISSSEAETESPSTIPAEWASANEPTLQAALALLDPTGSGVLDWRRAVVALAGATLGGKLAAASAADIAALREALLASSTAAREEKEGETEQQERADTRAGVRREEWVATRWWFDQPLEEGEFDYPAAVKDILFDAFSHKDPTLSSRALTLASESSHARTTLSDLLSKPPVPEKVPAAHKSNPAAAEKAAAAAAEKAAAALAAARVAAHAAKHAAREAHRVAEESARVGDVEGAMLVGVCGGEDVARGMEKAFAALGAERLDATQLVKLISVGNVDSATPNTIDIQELMAEGQEGGKEESQGEGDDVTQKGVSLESLIRLADGRPELAVLLNAYVAQDPCAMILTRADEAAAAAEAEQKADSEAHSAADS